MSGATPWRARIWRWLEEPDRGIGRAVAFGVATLILLNAAAVVIESVEPIRAAYRIWFIAFEVFSIAVFTIEFGLRLWASAEAGSRWRFLRSGYAIVDLAAIVPFYLGALFGWDLRMLRLLRLLRLAKLSRYFASIDALGASLRAEARPMAAALSIMGLLVVVAASLMYFAERDAQPEAFGDIPRAMWWAAVTLTTVGYGDVAPVTPVGRLIAVMVMALGVGMVALPAGMLASRFSTELSARREAYAARRRETASLGERQRLREKLGLSAEDAAQIDLEAGLGARCPTCGAPLRAETPNPP